MNDYYSGFNDFDSQSQEMLKDLQNFIIPVNNLQSKGYSKTQDVKTDKLLLGETQRGMSNVSPLAAYKFYNQTSDEISSKYFVDAPPPEEGTFTYISDVRSDLKEYIKDVKDFYYYGKVDKEHFAFSVILFSSTEATKLKECFDVCKPKGNEILIFVEDNRTDYASGTYGAIRISDDLIKFFNERSLKYKNTKLDFLSYDLKENQNVYDYLKSQDIGLTDEQIDQLFHKGYIEDTKIEIAKNLFKVASLLSSGISAAIPGLGILINPASRALVSGMLQSAIEGIEKGRLPENSWQPKPPKDDKGAPDENYQYQPIISLGNDKANIDIASIIKILNKKADEQLSEVRGILKISKDYSGNAEPKSIAELLYINYYRAYKIAKGIIAEVGGIGDSEILKYGVQAYNALLCGVWDGLVDAVSGLFAMVKMIFDAVSLGEDFASNIDKYLPTLLEQFDEALQVIKNLSFAKVAKYISGKLKQINLTFDPIACAYFVGYAYGFIISLIIEIVLTIITTGGSLTIPVIVEKLEEALLGIFRIGWGIAKGTVKAARTFAEFTVRSIKSVIEKFQELLNFLKKGWEEIKKMIDEVFEAIKDVRKKLNQAKWKELQKYLETRSKFHDMELVEQLWKKRIESKILFPNQLKSLYFKYLEEYPTLKRGFNQAEFKTTIKKKGKLIEEVEEFSVSGDKDKWLGNFGDPPQLPPNTINVLDDWENFEKFVEGAIDFGNRPRKYDSEIKYIFNFLKNHMNRGDEFVIETRNIFKTCGSCKREFVMLEDYLRTQGKKIKIVVYSDETIKGTEDLKIALKLKKKK